MFLIRQSCFSDERGSLSFVRVETTVADLHCFLFYFLNRKFSFLDLLPMVNLFFIFFAHLSVFLSDEKLLLSQTNKPKNLSYNLFKMNTF